MGFVDGTKERCPRLVEAVGGLIIADGIGDFIEKPEGDAGLEVLSGMFQ